MPLKTALATAKLAVSDEASCLPQRYQTLCLLVPEDEFDAPKAVAKANAANVGKLRVVAKHFRQPIEWNPARQMMDVVHADISGDPAQRTGQIIV